MNKVKDMGKYELFLDNSGDLGFKINKGSPNLIWFNWEQSFTDTILSSSIGVEAEYVHNLILEIDLGQKILGKNLEGGKLYYYPESDELFRRGYPRDLRMLDHPNIIIDGKANSIGRATDVIKDERFFEAEIKNIVASTKDYKATELELNFNISLYTNNESSDNYNYQESNTPDLTLDDCTPGDIIEYYSDYREGIVKGVVLPKNDTFIDPMFYGEGVFIMETGVSNFNQIIRRGDDFKIISINS